MVIVNQTLFQSAIQVFESPYGFPLFYVLIQDIGTVRNGGYAFEFASSIFDSNGAPLINPGDIFRYQDTATGALADTIVVGYDAANNWVLLNDAINTSDATVYKQNENPGCVLFVNGAQFGNGDIGVVLMNGVVVNYHIELTKDYLLPFIAKGIDTATSQNGIYALY